MNERNSKCRSEKVGRLLKEDHIINGGEYYLIGGTDLVGLFYKQRPSPFLGLGRLSSLDSPLINPAYEDEVEFDEDTE